MRIAILNMVSFGSTGKIMFQSAKTANEKDHETRTYSTVPYSRIKKKKKERIENHYYWGSFFENCLHYYAGSTLGRNGCFSCFATLRLIHDLKKFNPDIIHLHNLHSFCINFPMLFKYIRKNNIRVIWTLHDCWTFTGQCPHFDMIGCEKWKSECHHCPQISSYPKSRIDNSRKMYLLKKKWFTGINDMTLVTPSKWLADLVKQSFMKDYPVKVVNNGIDLSVFNPMHSDFRSKYNCDSKVILLGVAFGWGIRKGLDVFIELARRLDDNYRIVLVGTDDIVDKQLPENIISIHMTQNQKELAEIYSAADLFVNPTREENYPTVNMEALACGTPVLTFNTGGSPEIPDESCGSVVERDDIDALEKEIVRICSQRPYSQDACLNRAKYFDMYDRFNEYVELYER